MIIALSGRRVDAPDAETPRFPAGNVERVRAEVRRFFEEHHATVMVSSAACGADLIALSEAGFLGMQRKVVLPYARGRSQTSVTDHPAIGASFTMTSWTKLRTAATC